MFFLVRQGLISRSRAKSAFYGGSKTALSMFAKYFLPHILWSWCKSRAFWNAMAFSFQMKLSEEKKYLFLFSGQGSIWFWNFFWTEVLLKGKFLGYNLMTLKFVNQRNVKFIKKQVLLKKCLFTYLFLVQIFADVDKYPQI